MVKFLYLPPTECGDHGGGGGVQLEHGPRLARPGHRHPQVVAGVGGEAARRRVRVNLGQAEQLAAVGHLGVGVGVGTPVDGSGG